MKPCKLCGEPLQNNQMDCPSCQYSQLDNQETNSIESPKRRLSLSVFEWFMLLFENMLVILIIGIPISLIASMLLVFVFWSMTAIWVGMIVGLATAALFVCLREFFQYQLYRGPLK